MAEVLLGTVASAAGLASLTVQLVESGKKLKAFYDDVKDAPVGLQRVQEHLSTLAMLLNAVRSNEMMISVLTNSAQFEHCMRSCESAAKEVLLLVKKLEAGMTKSKRWGAIKSVMKKDDLKKLDERLEKAISLLHLSCSLHGIELFQTILQAVQSLQVFVPRPQHAAITGLVDSTRDIGASSSVPMPYESLSDEQDQSDVEEIPRTFEDSYRRTSIVSRKKTTRCRVPLFLVNKIWEFEYSRAISGWDAKFRTRRVVAWESDLFVAAIRADLEGVKSLLVTGRASIFDECPDGCNSLSICLTYCSENKSIEQVSEFCHFLMDQGVDSVNSDWYFPSSHNPDNPVLHEIHRRIVPYIHEPDLQQWTACLGQTDIISDLADKLDPPLHTHPVEYRLRLALGELRPYMFGTRHVTDALVARIGCELTNERVLRAVFIHDLTLLGGIVHVFGLALARGDTKARGRLIALFKAATNAGLTDWTHHMSMPNGSTLMHLFIEGRVFDLLHAWQLPPCNETFPMNGLRTWEGLMSPKYMLCYQRAVTDAIRVWLGYLSAAGVKLVDYGREVRKSMPSRPKDEQYTAEESKRCAGINWDYPGSRFELHAYANVVSYVSQDTVFPFGCCKILTFHTGPNPEDWKADFSWRLDPGNIWESAARDFCEIPNYTEQPIPGAWQSEWDMHDELEHITWPHEVDRSWYRYRYPSRGWRKVIARSLSEEAQRSGALLSPRRLLQQHQRRLRRILAV